MVRTETDIGMNKKLQRLDSSVDNWFLMPVIWCLDKRAGFSSSHCHSVSLSFFYFKVHTVFKHFGEFGKSEVPVFRPGKFWENMFG